MSLMSSCQGRAYRWMSPELLHPDHCVLMGGRPTKESDCSSLGMTIYEVLSCQAPFAKSTTLSVVQMILEGRRPGRPQGEEGKLFTDAVWRMLEQCWNHQPSDRASAKAVLLCLEGAPPSSWLSLNVDGGVTNSDSQSGTAVFYVSPRNRP